MNINEDKFEDINDMGEKDELHLRDGIAKKNQHNHFGPDQHEDQ